MGIVQESSNTKRNIYFEERDYDGLGWPYVYKLEIEYDLVFDNNSTLYIRLIDNAPTSSYEGPIPEQLVNKFNDFIICPNDTLIFSKIEKYGEIKFFHLRIDGKPFIMSGYVKSGHFLNRVLP